MVDFFDLVNVGEMANDGTGDPLRTAFIKLNTSLIQERAQRAANEQEVNQRVDNIGDGLTSVTGELDSIQDQIQDFLDADLSQVIADIELKRVAAEAAATLAEAMAQHAELEREAAQLAAGASDTAKGLAQDARDQAAQAVVDAVDAMNASLSFRNASEAAKDAAILAKNEAQTAATNADGSASASAGSASTASVKASEAGQSATAAQGYSVDASTAKGLAEDAATASSSSAGAASASESAAGQSAAAASNSATQANTARSGAETARDEAASSETNAAGSASVAASSASNAATSENNAGDSASAAATSASVASTKATEAGQSATAANAARVAAETAEGNAEAYQTSAATSASNAEGHAGSASMSAGLASDSANAAGDSASAASSSASTASTKANEASQSASAASASRIAAETAKGGAEVAESNAASSASDAAGSASSASSAASIAASASQDAEIAVVQSESPPSTFKEGLRYWTTDRAGDGSAEPGDLGLAFVTDDSEFGYAANWISTRNGQNVLTRGTLPWGGGRVYRVTVTFRVLSSTHVDGNAQFMLTAVGLDRNFQGAALLNTNGVGYVVGDAYTVSATFSNQSASGVDRNGLPNSFWVRFGLRHSRIDQVSETRIRSILVEDVTSEIHAEGFANAAFQSATLATASATDAGEKATIATTAAGTATTEAGKASTSASQAASSENNAAGSASTASNRASAAANSANAAGNSADAASTSASFASTKASEAGQSANAAATSATNANTARSAAQVARGDAVSAKESAEGYSADAFSYMDMSSRIVGRGTNVLVDQFLGASSGLGAFVTAPTWSNNSKFPLGRDASWNVNATTNAGLSIVSSNNAWVGPENADAYVIEVDFTLNSGSIGGAGVLFDWRNTGPTTFRTSFSFADTVVGSVTQGQMTTARGVVRKPGNFSGTFDRNQIHFMVNYTGDGLTRASKNITLHRISVRTATAEELGEGAVGATIAQKYATTSDLTQSVAQGITTYDASVQGGISATVTQSATAVADINGYLSSTAMLMAELSSGQIAGIRAVVHNGDGSANVGSLLQLIGDNVVAEGSLSARQIVVFDSTNYAAGSDGDWSNHRWRLAGPASIAPHPDGEGNVLRLGHGAGILRATLVSPIKVAPGDILSVSYLARLSQSFNGTTGNSKLRLGRSPASGHDNVSFANVPTNQTWTECAAEIEVPDGVFEYNATIVCDSTGGLIELDNIEIRRKVPGSTLITPNSVTTTELSASAVTTENLAVRAVKSGNIDIDNQLVLNGKNSGFPMGKDGAYNTSDDGLYVGRTEEPNGQVGFGFMMTKTAPSGLKQHLEATYDNGLRLTNANFYRDLVTAPAPAYYDTSRTINLTGNPSAISITLQGAGGGGRQSRHAFSDGNGPIVNPTSGGLTRIVLRDGTTVIRTWTAQGGAGATEGVPAHAGRGKPGTPGESSPWGGGGVRGEHSVITPGRPNDPVGSGGHGSGYGSGGGGAHERYKNDRSGYGGSAGGHISVSNYDVSGLSNPNLVITIGAKGLGGSGGALGPQIPGGDGAPGRVMVQTFTAKPTPADVVPLIPTAMGTMPRKGPFPNLGSGLWILIATGSGSLQMGNLRMGDGYLGFPAIEDSTATVISSGTPTFYGNLNNSGDIQYMFFKMGP